MSKSLKPSVAFIIEIALYVLAALSFFQGFHLFMADIATFRQIFKVAPMFLSYFMMTYLLFAYYFLTHQADEKKRAKALKGNAFGFIIAGGLLFILLIVNMILGHYEFGYTSLIFPIDVILIDVVIIALGVTILLKKEWILEKIPLICRGYQKPTCLTVLSRILGFIYVWIAEYFFAALLLVGNYIDFSTPTFGHTIPLYLLMIVGNAILLCHELYLFFSREKDLPKKPIDIARYICLGAVTLLSVYVLIADMTFTGYYVSDNLQGIFPIDFFSSLNVSPRLLAIAPLLALWFNFIMSITVMKKKETEPLS